MQPHLTSPVGRRQPGVGEVLVVFLRLGLSSFGGPIAHLGYFRRELVERRGWLSEAAYADLIGLCQFLPGPASSQAGFAFGLMRAGPWGGLAAWAGFTLPSAVALAVLGVMVGGITGPIGAAAIHGLKLVAVPIVAQAVIGMARTLAPDLPRALMALAAAALMLGTTAPAMQLVAIAGGALAGLLLCRSQAAEARPPGGWIPSRRAGLLCLALFAAALVPALLLQGRAAHRLVAITADFYRAGALVFGGGHVVLPLLRASLVPRWIGDPAFLAGYGAAQAVPGPLFTFSAYVGAHVAGVPGAAVALIAIFAPGLLLVAAALPFHGRIRESARAQRALAGVNAAVVGILAAALYDPLWITAIASPIDVAIALAGLAALWRWRVPPLAVVLGTVAASLAAAVATP